MLKSQETWSCVKCHWSGWVAHALFTLFLKTCANDVKYEKLIGNIILKSWIKANLFNLRTFCKLTEPSCAGESLVCCYKSKPGKVFWVVLWSLRGWSYLCSTSQRSRSAFVQLIDGQVQMCSSWVRWLRSYFYDCVKGERGWGNEGLSVVFW